MEHVDALQRALGWPQPSNAGAPAEMSSGMLDRSKDQIEIPPASQCMAKTPPPTALKVEPYEFLPVSRTPQPVLPLIEASQLETPDAN